MRVTPFFTPIWVFNTDADTALIKQAAQNILSKQPSVILSNRGGYHSPLLEIARDLPMVWNSIKPCLAEISTELGSAISVSGAWINKNAKHDYNMPHTHPGYALSGVLYIECNDQSGKIVFENPTASTEYPIDSTHPYFYGQYSLQPTPGMFVVFPSYLRHSVEQNLSDQDRWSMALNFKMD